MICEAGELEVGIGVKDTTVVKAQNQHLCTAFLGQIRPWELNPTK